MNHFTSRQMALLLAFLFPLSRMILFPASLAFSAGTGGISVVILCMALELLVCVAVIWLWKSTKMSYFQLITDIFGVWAGKIVACLYVLLFFVKLILILSSQKLMMFNVLYENVSQYILFLPIVVLLGYAGSKNSNSVARVFEISAWFVMVAFLGIMVLSASAVDFYNILPIFPAGGAGILKTAVAYPLYFGDFTFFLMFYSTVRKDFKSEWKMLFSWLINFVITVGFIIVFFGVFGTLSAGGTYAISNLSKYTVAFSQIGRYDFLFILVVGFGFIVLALALFHALLFAGEFVCGKRWIWSLVTAVVLFFAVKIASENFEIIMKFFMQYFSIFAIILQFALPILMAVIAKVKARKKHEI
ncbi:MAG: GerAB/ArcD/ProY family transporter [Bacillota bacterium]